MNANPHTHELTCTDSGSYWKLAYGDQTRALFKHPRLPQRMQVWLFRRQVAKMVRAHDKGSIKAGRLTEANITVQAYVQQVNQTLLTPQEVTARTWTGRGSTGYQDVVRTRIQPRQDEWAWDLLKKIPDEPKAVEAVK